MQGFNLANWLRIPQAMRDRRQWILTVRTPNGDKPPVAYGNWPVGTSTDKNTWHDFAEVMDVCAAHRNSDGSSVYYPAFVLSVDDPFMCIDVDDHGNRTPITQNTIDILMQQTAGTYMEKSSGGAGVHIFLQHTGGVPFSERGFKRGDVELYSQGRYILITGDSDQVNAPIRENNGAGLFAWLRSQLGGTDIPAGDDIAAQINRLLMKPYQTLKSELEGLREVYAGTEDNEKFRDLMRGEWAKYYTSGSEADMGLLSIAAQYTRNPHTLRVLWDCSGLSERKGKGNRTDYWSNTLAKVLADKPMVNPFTPEAWAQIEAQRELYNSTMPANLSSAPNPTTPFEYTDTGAAPPPLPTEANIDDTPLQDASVEAIRAHLANAPVPLRNIMADVFHHLLSPTYEMAAAVTLLATSLIAGKLYASPVRGDRLSIFGMVTAPSGAGKADTLNALNNILRRTALGHGEGRIYLWDASEGVSREGIHRVLQDGIGNMLLTIPEASTKFKQMSMPNAGAAAGVMRVMLDLYNADVLSALSRAKKDDSGRMVLRPNMCVLAEGTEDVFSALAHPDIITSGLPSRFISFPIGIPYRVENRMDTKGNYCSDWVANRMKYMGELLISRNHPSVEFTPIQVHWQNPAMSVEIQRLLEQQTIDAHTGKDNPTKRILRNRITQNSIRIASLISVMDNPDNPVITREVLSWSHTYVSLATEHMIEQIMLSAAQQDATNTRPMLDALKVYQSVNPQARPHRWPDRQNASLLRKYDNVVSRKVLNLLMAEAYPRRAGKQFNTDLRTELLAQGILARVPDGTLGCFGEFYRINV